MASLDLGEGCSVEGLIERFVGWLLREVIDGFHELIIVS